MTNDPGDMMLGAIIGLMACLLAVVWIGGC